MNKQEQDEVFNIGNGSCKVMEASKDIFKDVMRLTELISDPSKMNDPVQYEKICKQLESLARAANNCYSQACDSYAGYATKYYPDVEYVDMNSMEQVISSFPERKKVAKNNLESITESLDQAVKARYSSSKNTVNKDENNYSF